ncbi:MAG: aspartate-semialdehyde dehydrogenase [Proteobacteria bacterium]|nr:aspartate-semialdehyde dehydrogenase [Pseudomonadota bacterium]
MEKLKVGVIGATGMVGQHYIRLLNNHPWFEVVYVAASARSAGKTFKEAVAGRWLMEDAMPVQLENIVVEEATNVDAAKNQCDFVFSAVEISKEAVRELENTYASQGIPVVSNNSAHRHTSDVPMIIAEINDHHLEIIPTQQKRFNNNKGFVVVKPNCSLQSYMTPVYALIKAGYPIQDMIVSTMQAVSGAGYPGVSSLDMVDNVVPYIGGEEEKSEVEPLKILGDIKNGEFENYQGINISAHCNRVGVIDGHMACVSLKFRERKPGIEEIKSIWSGFTAVPQELDLPLAPKQPVIYMEEADRPQPRKDRNLDKAMAVTVGRLRECNVFDYRFVGLSHNTVRGAAGGGVLNAELLKARGFLTSQV